MDTIGSSHILNCLHQQGKLKSSFHEHKKKRTVSNPDGLTSLKLP